MPLLPSKTPLEPLAPGLIVVALLHGILGTVVWMALPLFQPKARTKPVPPPTASIQRNWFSPTDFKLTGVTVTPPAPESAPSPSVAVTLPAEAPKPKPPTPARPVEAVVPALEVPKDPAPMPLLEPQAAANVAAPEVLKAPAPADARPSESVPAAPVPESGPVRPTNKSITLSPIVDAEPQVVADPSRPPITLMEVVKQEKRQEAVRQAAGGADMDAVLNALDQGLKREWNAPSVQQVPVLQRQARVKFSVGRQGEILDVGMTRASGSDLLDASVLEAVKKLGKISQSLPSSFPKDRYTVEVNFHIE